MGVEAFVEGLDEFGVEMPEGEERERTRGWQSVLFILMTCWWLILEDV